MPAPDTPAVRICVLGPVRATVRGEPVDLGGPKQRAVLARLVLAHGQVVSVDRLIDDLWEGEPPPKALAALQAYISHLRRVLEPGRAARAAAQVIVSAAPGYCLRLPDGAVDVWSAEAKIIAAEEHPDLLEDVLTEWTGDPYAEVADTFWAAPEVARLTELRLSAVESYAAAQSGLGQYAVVVRVLEPHARDHPGREAAAGLLAAAHYRAGRQVAALDVLRRTREYLTDELGLEPGRALRDLERDILRQADHLDQIALAPAPTVLTAPASTAAPGPRTRGRAAELTAIGDAAARARRDGLRVVWIGGEAGAGKTTLVDAATATLRQSGWVAACGHCPEVDGAPPGWAWTEVLDMFRAALGSDHSTLAPLLHDGREASGGSSAFWVAHALSDVLGRAAAGQPLLVVLDDLHRTDGLTLELLRLVADRLEGRPVLMIGTYRPSESGAELDMARAALANHTAAHLILGGLDDTALVELAADCGLPTLTGETLKLLRDRTGGNPLFVREMARLMVAEGADAAHGGVPAGVRDVVRRRLARLPGQTATALRQAAVLGREVDLDLLGELAHSDDDDLFDALEPAVLAGLLDEPGPGRIRFAHSLIRDTLYDDTSLLRRTRLHATALGMLRRRDTDAASLAYHAVAAATADTASEAADFAIAAAAEATAVGAPGEAARQWRAAVRMLDLAAADPQRAIPARCGLISALVRAGDAISAREELNRTVTLAAGDDDLLVQALTAMDSPLVWRQRMGDLVDPVIVDPLRRMLVDDHPVEIRVRLLITLFKEVEGADHATAMAAAVEALDLARALHADDPATHGRLLCAALNVTAFAALGPDRAAEREPMAAELLSVAQDCGAVDYQAVGHWLLFLAASGRSDLAAARQQVDMAVARAGTGQLAYLLGVLDAYSAQLAVLAGRPDEGERRYLAAAASLAEHGVANGVLVGLVGRVSAALTRDDLGTMADELLILHRSVSRTMADGAVLALMAVGRTAEAREVWAQRMPLERSYYWVAMATMRVHAALAMDDLAVAEAEAAELRPYSGRMAGLDNGTLLTGPVDEALAALAESTGDTEAAARYRSAAAELRRRLAGEAASLL